VVVTGNHYFLDTIAGTVLPVGTWIAVTRIGAWLSVRRAFRRGTVPRDHRPCRIRSAAGAGSLRGPDQQ
jgi:hypothetical protein